jgi:ATP-dependent helicase/nuclease subunit A
MRTAESIPPEVRRQQYTAADPETSAWVAANAGSGKTHVLARRVINLLLNGVEPEKILCITFTKAAAANMAKRVFDTLAEWTTFDDAKLDEAIGEGSAVPPGAARRRLARRLFARALETPGGLKVQTIHAFCTQLLHQFPFEANVAARFTVLDEAEQSQLLERLTLGVLLDGAGHPGSALASALDTAMTAAADQTFRDVVREAIGKRDHIETWVEAAGGVEGALAGLAKTLGVDPSDTIDDIEAQYFTGSFISPSDWPAIAEQLAAGGKSDGEQAERFERLVSLSGAERVEAYLDIFCTAAGSGRTPRKSIVTKAVGDAQLAKRLLAEQERVCALLERRRAIACRDRSAALLTVAYGVLSRYAAEKQRRGLLDYDDLIDKALALLANVEAAWVHYKLDLGIDHVLIDEAQDTSYKQWEIVRRLIAEFTAGAGARGVKRTLFVVGDEKQSIFSFQNAAPKEFANMLRYFQSAHEKSDQPFVPVKFEHSFRSGAAILSAVDAVFKRRDIALSVTSDQAGFPPHIALSDALPSVVEIWEPFKPDERKEIEGWDAPFDAVSETSPRVKLSRRIARTVRQMVDGGGVRCGDVLILVRQRGELFEAIIRALKNQKLAVAGADRLMLTEHVSVMDLIALTEALLLPQDDLALATALRSPLFGFSDEDLFAIAYERGRAPLRKALAHKAAERPIFAGAAARLDQLAEMAQRETPFTFYARLLGEGGARRRFLSRLGPEANDALDEFLNLALDYERRETPSLQGFLSWLRDARAEVKRDMEIRRDEVRVMTVHGAKGLEAPVVVLADTMTPPAGPRPPRLLQISGGATIWAGRKADDVPDAAAARTAANAEAEHEYRRLLYVAMTRAAQRLIICGADGIKKRPQDCWYDLVRDALDPFLVAEGEGEEKVLLYRKGSLEGVAAPAVTTEPKGELPELPAWLRQAVRVDETRITPVTPSAAFEHDVRSFAGIGGTADAREKALRRGRIVHRLMQSVPDIPPDKRKSAIERHLQLAAADLPQAERDQIAQQVFAVLNDLVFAEVFAPGSRAEVSIVGRLVCSGSESIAISGQVDRLAVTSNSVFITDYKTDRIVPRSAAEAPKPYIGQLALYGAVLSRIYPEKTIRAALIFTGGPALVEVSAPAMAAALAEIVSETAKSHAPVKRP